jgi:hypothetical protein
VNGPGYRLLGGMGLRGVLKIDLKMSKFYKKKLHICSLKIVSHKGSLLISGLINMELSVEFTQ